MEVTNEMIDKLAHLARLHFDPAQKDSIRLDLQKMISFVDKLNELDTSGIEPLLHMSDAVNVLREDEPNGSIDRNSALKNAPDSDGIYFKVPKVISQKSE